MGDVKAPNCPTCGEFMDKVEVLVTAQLEQGTVAISKDATDDYVGWVCPKPSCNKSQK